MMIDRRSWMRAQLALATSVLASGCSIPISRPALRADPFTLGVASGSPTATEVVLWTIEGGGHTWPGGDTTLLEKPIVGAVNRDIFASEEMWNFFQKYSLR